MKKAIALLLCLLMMTSLVACGNNNTATDDSQTSQVETENNETSTPEESEETPTEAETETPAESEETELTEDPTPAFDTSWMGADYVMPIPEPPYDYEIREASNTEVRISATDEGNDNITHDIILAYCDELKNAGFTQNLKENEIGERYGRICYEFSADNGSGASVYLIDDGGGVALSVIMETSADGGELDFGRKNSAIFPELPECDWVKVQLPDDSQYAQYCAEGVTPNVIAQYLNELTDAGWDIEQKGKNWWCEHDTTEQTIQVFYNESEKFASITIANGEE